MIKINLRTKLSLDGNSDIKVGDSSLSPEVKKQAAAKLLVAMLFPLAVYAYEWINISALQTALNQVGGHLYDARQEQTKYGDVAPRVEKYTKEKKKIDEEVEVVRQLAKNRLREVKTLDLLQSLTPIHTWLHQLDLVDSNAKMVGFTRSDESLNELVKKLENSSFFSRIDPKGMTQEKLPTGPAKKFTLEFKVGMQE